MKRILALAAVLAAQATATQSFYFSYGGRTYTITTTYLAHMFTFDSSHWTYEPSVVLPSVHTNNQYVLIFSSGTTFRQEGIYVTASNWPDHGFPSATQVLSIAATSNLCDMIDARPYWDDSSQIWHVYVQAIETCPGGVNSMYEATGPSLNSLSWVFDYGNHAQKIVAPYGPNGNVGIGEVLQGYNSMNYLGPYWLPMTTTFNDWT